MKYQDVRDIIFAILSLVFGFAGVAFIVYAAYSISNLVGNVVTGLFLLLLARSFCNAIKDK